VPALLTALVTEYYLKRNGKQWNLMKQHSNDEATLKSERYEKKMKQLYVVPECVSRLESKEVRRKRCHPLSA